MVKINKFIGQKINSWTIISEDKSSQPTKNKKYLIKCDCGFETSKTLCNINKTRWCFSCAGQNKSSSLIGKKIYSFTALDNPRINGKVCLKIQCDCGEIRYIQPSEFKNKVHCNICARRKLTQEKVGKISGCFKVISVDESSLPRKLLVECINCGSKKVKLYSALKLQKNCSNCFKNLKPGLVVDGITLIERSGSGYWKLKCFCGNLYESLLRKYNRKLPGCGCQRRVRRLEEAKKKIGLKYKHLKITKILGFENGHIYLELKCKCGNIIKRPNGNEFRSESCGCQWHSNCKKGEEHMFCKLTTIDILSLRELNNSKLYSTKQLSDMYGIGERYLKDICNNKKRVEV